LHFRSFLVSVLFAVLLLSMPSQASYPRVLIQTNYGDITVELYNDKAPITVENFLKYVRTGFYDDLLFHRVINGFMIQGGGYYAQGGYVYEYPGGSPIINESYNNLSNLRGTIAMARTSDPNSATSEFYINQVDNLSLDRKNAADGFGYCVFGRVISDMNVVDTIALIKTYNIGGGLANFPVPIVIINKAKLTTPGYWLNADLNNNGHTDLTDFAYFAANWKKTGSNLWGDLNQNNVVDMRDLYSFSQGWLNKTSWYTFAEDLNNDKIANLKDFAKLSQTWKMSGLKLEGDIDKNQIVDYLDIIRLKNRWLQTAQ
jgi:peptidyl-prolyl cis-trans isomerase B (cyclophilin B)